MSDQFEIRIRKEALKFAASHMTVFPDGTKESLHGHQYQPTLTVVLKDVRFEKMIPFSEFKLAMKKIAKLWDEKVFIASENPFYHELKHDSHSLEFTLCEKRYLLPSDEVIILKTDNITCENLAKSYYEFLKAELEELFESSNITSISIYIEESPGQGAAYTHVHSL